jgi:hypothetical protein
MSMHRCVALAQEQPPPLPSNEAAPSVYIEMQLPVTKTVFLSQQDYFLKAIARTAGVNPQDVTIVSATEVNQARRLVSLVVVTAIRSRDAQAVEQALTLSTVNAALEEAGLPWATTMQKKTQKAALSSPVDQKALAENSTGQRPSSIDIRLLIAAVAASVGVLFLCIFGACMFRRKRRETAHAVHEGLPSSLAKEFGVQISQGPPSGPECPRSQRQPMTSAVPAGELAFAGHGWQVVTV